jgi:outer membrane protein assembly factor BamA
MSAIVPNSPRPRGRRRLRRIAWISFLVLVVLPLLLVVGVVVALRGTSVRRAVLDRLSTILREDYGLAATAEDFSPLWRRSGVVLRKVRLGVPGAAPLATADRVEAVVDLGSLRSRPFVVKSLTADGLRVDLAAPLPKVPQSTAPIEPGPPVEILAIKIRHGEVRGAPLDKPAADWLRSWNSREIEARGSYRGGRMDLEVTQAAAILDRPGFGLQALRLAGRVGYEDKKPLRLDGLEVAGDGLRLTASGTVGLEPGQPAAGRFDLDAEPLALVAGLPRRGRIRANGEVDGGTGKGTVTAQDIPAEALKPYLDPKLYADLALAGTLVDLKASAGLGPGNLARVAGTAQAGWRRGALRLARADLWLTPGRSPNQIDATVVAELLPGSPGSRSAQGTFHATGWAELAKATAEKVQAQVRLPDVGTALAEARSLWPRLIPAPPAGVPLQGSLAADAHLSGSLAAPTAGVDATWLPQEGALVRLQAKGQPRTMTGSATVRTETLPLELLAAFAPGLAGTVTGSAELAGSPRGYRTKVNAAMAALSFPPSLQRLENGTLAGEGTLSLKPFFYRGTLSVEGAGLVSQPSASATARLETFQIAADGTLAGQPLTYDGTLSLDGTGVEISGQARVDHLVISARGKGGADPRSLAARAKIDAGRLTLAAAPETEISKLHVEAEGDAREVRLIGFSGELPAGRGGIFAGSGRATIEPLFAEADLDLHLVKPLDALAAADLTARLRNGVLEVTSQRLDTASGPASLKARVPLGALKQVPALTSAIDAFPGKLATGPLTLALEAPDLDSKPLLAALGMEPRPERVRGAVSAQMTLDLAAPAAGQGEVRLSGLTAETPDGRVTAQGPAVLKLGGGRLELLPVHLVANVEGGDANGVGADLHANADLSRSWRLTDPPAGLVTRLAADASGALDAALLNPYLQGGAAAGSLAFSAHASGPPAKLTGNVEVSGPGASFFFSSAGLRITDPKLAADLAAGRWTIREGKLGVNGGTVDLAGGFSPQRGVEIDAQLAKVRYRLDYGIDTQLSGRLAFRAPPGERGRLSGRVVVDRGVLDRDLNLDREVFTLLFKPRNTPSTVESALAAVDLALEIETADGVRVKNNVGDLRASWRRLTLDGTLDAPVLRGRIDIDPGGLFYAYGQTVRIDSGSLLFTGDPATDPQVSLTTTSSLQDPSIARLQGESPLDLLAQQENPQGGAPGVDTGAALTAGFASYYGASLLQRLSQSAGLGGFSVRPVLVFNEADPSARLTVGRDLSRNVSLAVSIDLRNAERQTYLFYVQELSALPGLRAEGFTNDVGHRGGSLQQAFNFGGGERKKESGPRLRRLDVSTPRKGVSKREIRAAVRLEKKQPVPEGAAFGVEVDVTELLKKKGYPDPRIAVAISPVDSKPGWVDVAVTVEPGPRVSFAFAGDAPSRALRPAITSLYRTDFYEAGSIEEMRKATVRAFRSTGHLDPKVEIDVRRETAKDPKAVETPRTVTIRTEAGRRQPLRNLRFVGLDPEVEQLAAASFPGTLARAELAAGLPNADSRLLAALSTLGFPAARIAGRSLEGDGLVVRVEPGLRQVVAVVRVNGEALTEGERARLAALLPLHAGEPARMDLAARGSQLLEDDLHRRGYADAKVVRSAFVPTADRPNEVELRYDVDPGIAYRLAAVALTGERWSRPAPLLRATGLRVGEPFTDAATEEARTRLFRTGLFSRVDAEVKKDEGEARVTLGLAEKPRFHLGYGVRWESSVGTGAVLDFVDQNFLGRAITVGLRGLYQTDDRSGRLYLRTGGVLGTPISFESYAEARRLFTPGDSNLVEDRREVAVEAQRPVGAHDTAHLYVRYRTTHIFEVVPDPFFPLDLEIRLPLAGLQLLRDTRDDKIDPRRGLFASLDLSGSGSFLGSDFQYARLFGQVASFRGVRLAGRPWTWAQSVRLGIAHPFAGQEIIRDELFFAGGPFSVRGYRQETLGPQESLGDFARAAGGEALFVINEELRFTLPFSLTGLAFFDAGQVWAHPRDASFDLAKSIGFGLRASTPVGLLRLDAAYPLDRRPGDGRYKIYVGFGNAF